MRKVVMMLMAIFLSISHIWAQQRTITGKVTDENGNPLPNVSILVKGTNVGTVTKADGTYSVSVPASAKTIVFSGVGLKTSEFNISTQSVINASLSTVNQRLEEVVVVAYSTQKRSNLTGSVATVKTADIENKPLTSVDKALQGAVAGLQSAASSGAPGANQSILIRGVSSINASNSPLWVIDGVPVNTGDVSRLTTTANLLSTLNPNDIESISVLKDAASQSVYGSRAANGVIIVTTRKGRSGKTKFRFDTEVGQSDVAWENPLSRPLNAEEYFDVTEEGLLNAGYTSAQTQSTLSGLGYGNGIDFNWYEAVKQKASQQQLNLSAEGGNDRTTFFVSGSYFRQEGIVINTDLNRVTSAFRISHKVNDKLNINVNVNGGLVKQRTPLGSGSFGNPVLSAYFIRPSSSAYNSDGTYNTTSVSGLHNTIALTEWDKRRLREGSLRGNVSAEYKFTPWLKFKTSISEDLNVLEEDQYNNPNHGDGQSVGGRAYSYYTRYANTAWTNTLDFDKKLDKRGDINLFLQAGYESQASRGYFISVQSQVMPASLDLTWAASGASPITASATISDYTFVSQFSNANIGYKGRYIVSGSFRRDGSSRFSPNNRYGTFWSIGASWNMEKENFFSENNFINQLKLRVSYGVNGNAGIGNYSWQAAYSTGYNYNQLTGTAPSNVGDPNLTWELNKPFNVGLDLGILKGRINITADYYIRKSEDLLLSVELSRTSGFSSATRNIGAMENRGFELTLNIVPVRTKDFTWNIDFNLANNKNKVTTLPGGRDIVSSPFIYREGLSVYTFYMREYAGVDPATGNPLWYTDATHNSTTGTYSSAQLTALDKTSLPKSFGSLTNTFRFKGFSLETQFYYNFGNYSRDTYASYYLGAGFGGTYNKVARVLDRWQKSGDVTDIPKYVYGGNNSFHSLSSFYLNKGDYIRLRNVQLGCDLPKSVADKLKIGTAFFYVRGTNLWTWVKDKNLMFDPEQGISSASNLQVFIPKTVTVGLNLSF